MSETIAVLRQLERALDSMPKEGMKAAIAQGILERVKEIVEEALADVNRIECVASGRGICKETYCNPKCGNIFLIREGDRRIISKVGSNAIGIEIANERVSFKLENVKMNVTSSDIEIVYYNNYIDKINYDDFNDLYVNNYTIKYTMRRIGKPLSVITADLLNCAKQNALVCK